MKIKNSKPDKLKKKAFKNFEQSENIQEKFKK